MHSSHKQPLDLQFEHLRTFLALADSGSFSRTGDQIGLSQSAVSRHIRALESSLGLRLFERMGRQAVLTSAGNVLRTRLEALMREAETLPRIIKDLTEGVRGELRIGACVTAANSFLPMLLGRYRRQYPEVQIALRPGSTPKIIDGMRRGDLDLGFVGSDAAPSNLAVVAKVRDEIVLIAGRKDPLTRRRPRPADLSGRDFIQREPASDTRSLVTKWFDAHGIEPRNAMDMW